MHNEHIDDLLALSDGAKVHVTLSHEVGQLGLLEREGASILNAALRPLASRLIPAFQQALQQAGIEAPLQLTSNDGTLISAEAAQKVLYVFSDQFHTLRRMCVAQSESQNASRHMHVVRMKMLD